MTKNTERALTMIAMRHFEIETLETRNSDSIDFHDVAVSSIKEALKDANELGLENARKG
ncbi:MAG: hypothetical protein OXQ30_01130 [Boseongicola sp.]|nr:hypothetical protein [Boseongicola sp.]